MDVKYRAVYLRRMARSDPQVNFRIPERLNERLKESAAASNRSITAELVTRLEESYDPMLEALKVALAPLRVDLSDAARRSNITLAEEIAARLDKDFRAYGMELTINFESGTRPALTEVVAAIADIQEESGLEVDAIRINVNYREPTASDMAKTNIKTKARAKR